MNNLKLNRLPKQRLADQLYGQLLEQIVSGAIKEGEKLPSENQICKAFEVSRPTVREALLRLHADGLVRTQHGLGTFVERRPSSDLIRLADVSDVAEILRSLEVRMGLETQAAALAAQRRSAVQLTKINSALALLQSGLERGGAPASADFELHLSIAHASGNQYFSTLLETLSSIVQSGMMIGLSITQGGSKERALRVFEEHENIVDAIRRGDADGAALAMRYHLYRSRQRITDRTRDI